MLRVSLALVATLLALGAAVLPAPPPGAAAVGAPSATAPRPRAEAVREAERTGPMATPAPADRHASACPRCEATPDLTQTDPALGLPAGGHSHCGPVAAANALAWLSRHGFPALAPEAAPEALPSRLAGAAYMRTHARRGTLPFDLVEGLERWVRDAGYHVDTLAYAGVRDHPARCSAGLARPNLAFLAAGLERQGVVLLHLGWYGEARPGRLSREGGHWVTLVDVEPPSGTLWLHDPAPYAQTGQAERVRAQGLTQGRILRPRGLHPLPAEGFLELGEGFPRRSPDERAIVDGALVLRVSRAR